MKTVTTLFQIIRRPLKKYIFFILSPSPMVIALHRVSPPPTMALIYSAVPVALYLYTERKQTSADL